MFHRILPTNEVKCLKYNDLHYIVALSAGNRVSWVKAFVETGLSPLGTGTDW
jgi:hypothetical protein